MKNSFLIKLALALFVGGILVTLCGLALNNSPAVVTGAILAGHCSTILLVGMYRRGLTVSEGFLMSMLSSLKIAWSFAMILLTQFQDISEGSTSLLHTQAHVNIAQIILGCDILFCIALTRCGWNVAVHPGIQRTTSQ